MVLVEIVDQGRPAIGRRAKQRGIIGHVAGDLPMRGVGIAGLHRRAEEKGGTAQRQVGGAVELRTRGDVEVCLQHHLAPRAGTVGGRAVGQWQGFVALELAPVEQGDGAGSAGRAGQRGAQVDDGVADRPWRGLASGGCADAGR